MRGQRLTGAREPAKGHDANQQSIQDLTFMQKVLSCGLPCDLKQTHQLMFQVCHTMQFHKFEMVGGYTKDLKELMEGSYMHAQEFTVPYNEFIEHN